jgi:hypothetical protein
MTQPDLPLLTGAPDAETASTPAEHQPPTDNLAIWRRVECTDPNYTTPMTGPFNGTAVNPVYMIRKATELFGPIGIDWGYDIVEESFVEGQPFGVKEDGANVGNCMVHILRLSFWYTSGGRIGRFEQFGQTSFIGVNSFGVYTDGDVKKKSLTDALTKCLSYIGIAADVHMGRFDDSSYVNARIAEYGNQGFQGSTASIASAAPPGTPVSKPRRAASGVSGVSGSAPSAPRSAPASGATAPTALQAVPTPAPRPADVTANEGTDKESSPPPKVIASATNGNDVAAWLKRIKTLGLDALKIGRETATATFSGPALEQIEQAISERENFLAPKKAA